jgi:N-dimethylarginine dimethylaminohydrolase
VLLRRPRADVSSWTVCGWRASPDPRGLAAEHEQLCALLAEDGVDVLAAEPSRPGTLDEIYAFDPALVADEGVVLLRPAKELRRSEPAALAEVLERAEVPVLGRIEAPAVVDGGDLLRLDERTLLVGLGYRTSVTGAEALSRLLPDLEILAFDLPHLRGPGEVLHLLSLLSPLDRDLAVGFLPLLPVRLVALLREREIRLIEVPEGEFDSMGPNVLALGPRRALMLERNVETRRRLEKAGVDVETYAGRELSKGDGGPTCLTLPLARDHSS